MIKHLQCPWDQFAPATMGFCEERICSWIREPSNAWSNLAYLVVGIFIVYLSRRQKSPVLGLIGWIEILLSFCSFAFHATATFWGEYIDIGSMFLFANYAFCFNLWRLKRVKIAKLISLYLILTLAALIGLYQVKPAGILLFAALITGAGIVEILNRRKFKDIQYRYLVILCMTFIVSFIIWGLDRWGIVCRPSNHFLQGHAVWHILNSTCFLWLYLFYQQFDHSKHD